MDREEYLKRVKSYIKVPTQDMEDQLEDFCKSCSYISGQYDQDESFVNLKKHLEELENGREETNRIFYMALPPSVFITVSQHLKKVCYPKNGIARIIVGLIHGVRRRGTYRTDDTTGGEAIRERPWQFKRATKSLGTELDGG